MDEQPTETQETPPADTAYLSEEDDDPTSGDVHTVTPFSWDAHEYVHHDKSTGWFLALFLGAVALGALAVVTKQWFSLAVVVAMAAAVASYANKQPRVLNYTLDDTGLTIGSKHYPYSQFKSFSVTQDKAWHSIDFDPIQRFMAQVTVLFDDDDLDEILDRLEAYLPRHDREPDIIERLSRYLRF